MQRFASDRVYRVSSRWFTCAVFLCSATFVILIELSTFYSLLSVISMVQICLIYLWKYPLNDWLKTKRVFLKYNLSNGTLFILYIRLSVLKNNSQKQNTNASYFILVTTTKIFHRQHDPRQWFRASRLQLIMGARNVRHNSAFCVNNMSIIR